MKKYIRTKVRNWIAREISSQARYYDGCYQVYPRKDDEGEILSRIECGHKNTYSTPEQLPDVNNDQNRRIVLLNGVFNFCTDIESLLNGLGKRLSRYDRVVVVTYNPYLRFLFSLANSLGIRSGEIPTTFLTRTDLFNIAKLSRFEVTRLRPIVSLFSLIPLFGRLIESIMRCIPFASLFCITTVITLRPLIAETGLPKLSVVIPARNEKGNIENAVVRLKTTSLPLQEVIFVEGHSTDGTWEEIERVIQNHKASIPLKVVRQTGVGKADAVRDGMRHCTGELVTVLDADLTMPPEALSRFYDAFRAGLGDFINGSRLLYPMEDQAMRFLNRVGNIFFAKTLSYLLDSHISDTLCGTKMMLLRDYERFQKWRSDFGDFDPFGDFELLFPAAILSLGIIDVPIQYRARQYGTTNIRRFSDGLQLLKMATIGLIKIKMK